MPRNFDLEAVYDAEIAPLMDRIIAICKQHKLPMLADFYYKQSPEEGDSHCTTLLHFDERPMPAKMAHASDLLEPAQRAPMLQITVTEVDGSKKIIMVAGD